MADSNEKAAAGLMTRRAAWGRYVMGLGGICQDCPPSPVLHWMLDVQCSMFCFSLKFEHRTLNIEHPTSKWCISLHGAGRETPRYLQRFPQLRNILPPTLRHLRPPAA